MLVNTESVHSSVWKSVHNKLVQYGKMSTMSVQYGKGPQYSRIKGRKCTIVCFPNMEINQNLSLGHKPTKDTIM